MMRHVKSPWRTTDGYDFPLTFCGLVGHEERLATYHAADESYRTADGKVNNAILCPTCLDEQAREHQRLVRDCRTVPTHVLGQLANANFDLRTLLRLLNAASDGYAVGERRREMFGEPR